MVKDERESFADSRSKLIENMNKHLNEEIGVINTSERNRRTRKGKLVFITDNTATFEFSLGENHTEMISYLLTDLWRGTIELEGVPFASLVDVE